MENLWKVSGNKYSTTYGLAARCGEARELGEVAHNGDVWEHDAVKQHVALGVNQRDVAHGAVVVASTCGESMRSSRLKMRTGGDALDVD